MSKRPARWARFSALSGGEVVQDTHVMSGREEGVHEMGADEAGAAGDEVGGHGLESILNFKSQISN